MVLGSQFLEALRTIAKGENGNVAEAEGRTFTVWIPAKLVEAARRGEPGADVYECSLSEVDLVNLQLGANWSGALNWRIADGAEELEKIRKVLNDTYFTEALEYCEEQGLGPKIHAQGVQTRLNRISVFVDWSNGTGEVT